MQSPMASVSLNADVRAVQITGSVSLPIDAQDWIQFAANGRFVAVKLSCRGGALQADLWKDGGVTDSFSFVCGESKTLSVEPNSSYSLSLTKTDGAGQMDFVLKLESGQ